MGLRQKVRLELEDGTELVTEYSAIDIRMWEKIHRKSALSETMSVGMLTWLGWNSAKRHGSINGAFDKYEAFDAVCVDVQGVDDDEEEPDDEADPSTKAVRSRATPKARGRASSAPSPSEPESP